MRRSIRECVDDSTSVPYSFQDVLRTTNEYCCIVDTSWVSQQDTVVANGGKRSKETGI